MKKAAVFSLLLLFAFNSIGYYALFFIREHQLEEEFEHTWKYTLPDDRLTLVVVDRENITEIEWDGEEEFLYRDNYYDVVRKEVQKDGSTWYHCFRDDNETRMFAEMKKTIENSASHNRNDASMQKVMKSMAKEYLCEEGFPAFTTTERATTHTLYLIPRFTTGISEILIPPPNLV